MQSAALQATVLEDCINSGKAFASLSCDGQASMPSFSSKFADALTQVSHWATLSLQCMFSVLLHGNSKATLAP